MADWQPIETAPKDGADILVTMTHNDGLGGWITHMWVDSWSEEYPWPEYERRIDLLGHPTHWMALPAPPK